nr:hypothetical protein [Lachnospiraceae bacterium]
MTRCVLDEKRRKKEFKKSLYENYGKMPSKKYPEGRLGTLATHFRKNTGFCVDDITWNDLEMDKVFCRMDYTFSATGEEMLYALLRLPTADEDELTKREKLIGWFSEHADDRVKLQLLFAAIGRTGKYSIYEYMDYLDGLKEKKNTRHYAVIIAMVIAICVCFSAYSGIGFVFLCGLLCYNLASYFKEKGEIDPYITTFSYMLRILEMESRFSDCKVEVIADMVADMDEKSRKFQKFRRFSSLLTHQDSMSGNPMDILMDYVRMGLHLNLIKFNTMLSECKKYKDDMISIIETMGFIESMISVAAYRASLEYHCIPVLSEKTTISGENDRQQDAVSADAIYHPLLSRPVNNTFEVKKGMLLTGSNASGKSTFLKTIAIAQIMAQSVHTVCAKEYRSAYYRVYSSMALRDNLESNESYFIVEIKALKRILEAAEEKNLPVMCFVDEVLRGTNTVERIAAASEILSGLARQNVLCFAATHDIELTSILEEQYENYHFDEIIENGDVKFNYLLKEGKATSRNAIRLLSVLGYEEDIIRKAEKRASDFLTDGEWK